MQTLNHSVPQPSSAEEIQLVVQASQSISQFAQSNRFEQDRLVQTFLSYECYTQVIALLDWRFSHAKGNDQRMEDAFLKLRILFTGLEDNETFNEFCYKIIKDLDLSFNKFRYEFLELLVGEDNFAQQAATMEVIFDAFTHINDQISLLERLAVLYEKKLFHESKTVATYKRILAIDPFNVKSLRFFKLFYLTQGRWADGAEQLENLTKALTHPLEIQRTQFELAQVYLYNLNKPEKCKEILKPLIENSRIHVYVTYIDALEKLEDFAEIVSYLNAVIEKTDSVQERTKLRFKQAQICNKQKHYQEANQFLYQAIDLHPKFLLAYEMLINNLIELKNKKEIQEVLKRLERQLINQRNKDVLIEKFNQLEHMAG